MKLNNRGNWSLIGLLVVAVIAIGGIAFYYGNSGSNITKMPVEQQRILNNTGGTSKTIIGKSFDAGRSVDCQNRISQIRQSIQMYRQSSEDGANAPSLDDLKMGVGADYFNCPVSKQPYVYNSSSGNIQCPTHPKY